MTLNITITPQTPIVVLIKSANSSIKKKIKILNIIIPPVFCIYALKIGKITIIGTKMHTQPV